MKPREWLQDFWKEFRERLQQDRYRETFSFLSKLLFAGIIFRLAILIGPDMTFFQQWLAAISGWLLDLLGYSFTVDGILLRGEPTNYLITRDCLGWKSIAAFVALVFASTEDLRNEVEILALGALGLAAANVLRVVTTIVLSEAGVISFEIVHTFLWRWGMTLLVLGIWYLWLNDRLNPEIQGIFK